METEIGKGRRLLILANACVLTFMATLDGSIVNIALPTISRSLGIGIESVQWVVTSYLIAISALLLVWGRLSDIHGRRLIFAAGLAVFSIGSLLCGLSTSLAALVLSRVVQAVGASMSMALVQGIVTATFPPAERGKALGLVGSVVAVGSLCGPSLGGILVAAAGWRSIFFVNVPIGLIGFVATFLVMPESRAPEPRPSFDKTGAILLASAIALFFVGLLAFQEGLLGAPAAALALVLAIVLFLVFLKAERKADPIVDESLFSNRTFRVGVWTSFLSFVSMTCYSFFMPFYLQSVRGLPVLQAGLVMSLYPLVTAVLAPVSGALSDRVNYRILTVFGLLCNAAGLALLTSLGAGSSIPHIGSIIVLLGLGGASFTPPNNSSVMGAVPRDRLGIAGGLNSFFRNLGMVGGATFAVSLFSLVTKTGMGQMQAGALEASLFMKGYRVVILSASAIALSGAVLELIGRSRRKMDRDALEAAKGPAGS